MSIGLDETHDPARGSWVKGADGHPDFPVQNLPLGLFSPPGGRPRPGSAIGDSILDLRAVSDHFPSAIASALAFETLNPLMALPATARNELRKILSRLLSDVAFREEIGRHLHAAAACTLHLPARIGDYSDFYVGIHHAVNVGRLFRPDTPLLANYKHIPIGYHGRASSVRASGIPVVRPSGQRKSPAESQPVFEPTQRLDYELELGVWIGEGNALGRPIAIAEAGAHVAGLCLLNDWSARDFQAWEYQPLGPFLAKSFHTTVSPWVVTMEALAPFRFPHAGRAGEDPAPLPYLWDEADQALGAFAIEMKVTLSSAAMREAGIAAVPLATSHARHMYWTIAQLVAHHSSNGCNLAPGDLLGSGTISGPDDGALGSLLELTRGGERPVALPDGTERTFLQDGDEVGFTGRATAHCRVPIGFGSCVARIAG